MPKKTKDILLYILKVVILFIIITLFSLYTLTLSCKASTSSTSSSLVAWSTDSKLCNPEFNFPLFLPMRVTNAEFFILKEYQIILQCLYFILLAIILERITNFIVKKLKGKNSKTLEK